MNFLLRHVSLATFVAVAAVAAACGDGSAGAPAPSNPAQASSSTGSGSVGSGKAVSIHVTLGGGPTPGSWDVSSDQPCQSTHTQQTGTIWGVEFTNSDQSTTKLGTFSLGYGSDGPQANKFTVQALVGDPASPTGVLYVATTLGATSTVGGSGTVSLQDAGATVKFAVDAKTKEGYSIKATAQCNKVERISA